MGPHKKLFALAALIFIAFWAFLLTPVHVEGVNCGSPIRHSAKAKCNTGPAQRRDLVPAGILLGLAEASLIAAYVVTDGTPRPQLFEDGTDFPS